MSQQCAFVAKQANSILGCIMQSITSRMITRGGDPSPPLSSSETRLEEWVWFWVTLSKTDMDILGRVQPRGTKMVKGLELLTQGERLGELGLFGLERRWLGAGILSGCVKI